MDIKTTSKNLFSTAKDRVKELWDKEQEEDNVDLVIRRLNEGYYDQLPNGQERKTPCCVYCHGQARNRKSTA